MRRRRWRDHANAMPERVTFISYLYDVSKGSVCIARENSARFLVLSRASGTRASVRIRETQGHATAGRSSYACTAKSYSGRIHNDNGDDETIYIHDSRSATQQQQLYSAVRSKTNLTS